MTSYQKVIKYCAMGFAAFLAISIIGGILSVILAGIGCVVNLDTGSGNSQSTSVSSGSNSTYEYAEIDNIKIDIGTYKTIVKGAEDIDTIEVGTNNTGDDLSISVSGDTLEIESNETNWFSHWFDGKNSKSNKGAVYVYVPIDYNLDELNIDSGVGSLSISDIETETLLIDSGVGSVSCKHIKAGDASIDTGVGSTTLSDVTLNGLDLSGGVGSVEISGVLTGNINVEGGIGSVDITIDGDRDNYNIDSETGVGGFYLDGEKAGDVNYYSADTENSLYVEGGMGSISVNFE